MTSAQYRLLAVSVVASVKAFTGPSSTALADIALVKYFLSVASNRFS